MAEQITVESLEINPHIIKLENQHILYDSSVLAKPSAEIFDPGRLEAQGLLVGRALGRGEAHFFRYQGRQWVLRHYRRGGLIAKLLHDQFAGWRLEGSRSWAEWRLIADLYAKGLPVPRPVAAGVRRRFGVYRADLVTERIANTQTLGRLLQKAPLPAEIWSEIGACVRRFHEHGVYHADLNANNILLDDQFQVYLIDFDRGRLRRPGGWQKSNVDRLERSLHKLKRISANFHFDGENWQSLMQGYVRF